MNQPYTYLVAQFEERMGFAPAKVVPGSLIREGASSAELAQSRVLSIPNHALGLVYYSVLEVEGGADLALDASPYLNLEGDTAESRISLFPSLIYATQRVYESTELGLHEGDLKTRCQITGTFSVVRFKLQYLIAYS